VNAAEFNAAHPVGTPVVAYPGTRNDEGLITKTRTPAWELGHGAPVVSVDGYAGGICLTHIDVRKPACNWNPVQATTDCDWDRNCPVHGENPTTAAAVEVMGALPMPAGPASAATPRWHQLRHELIATVRPYMPETAATKAVDLVDELVTEALLEGAKKPSTLGLTGEGATR
jgi:hypothetical protein